MTTAHEAYAQAITDIAGALREHRHEMWNGNERRPSGFASAAQFVEHVPNPYREASDG